MTAGRRSERAPGSRRSLALGLVALTALGCAGGGGRAAGADDTSHPLVGAPAPAFELQEVAGGRAQSLSAHAGKVVVVDFWATWCEPCRQSFPAYQKLVTQLGGDLVVVGISQDDDTGPIPAFVSQTGVSFPIVWDDGKSVAQAYSPPTMPTAFVIDKSGIVRFVHVGYRAGDEDALASEVRSLLH